MYSCYNCYKRAIMEVFYALIVFTQIYGLVKEWYKEWKRLVPWCPSCKHSGLLPEELKEKYIVMKKCPNPKCDCVCDVKIEEEKSAPKDQILKVMEKI
jgi:hypothetical protein